MLKALDNTQSISKYAWSSSKKDAPFYCPDCLSEVILKKGLINIEHFAHKNNTDCGWGIGESLEHLTAKQSLYQYLINNGINAKLEDKIGELRSDITFLPSERHEIPVAVELQRSYICTDRIIDKTVYFSKHNHATIWIPLPDNHEHKTQLEYFRRLNDGWKYEYDNDNNIHIYRIFYIEDDLGSRLKKVSLSAPIYSTEYFSYHLKILGSEEEKAILWGIKKLK